MGTFGVHAFFEFKHARLSPTYPLTGPLILSLNQSKFYLLMYACTCVLAMVGPEGKYIQPQ